MAFRFCSFASGSSGNSYLIKTDRAALLLDCGITGKREISGLLDCGTDPSELSAILITHEHLDHVRSLRMMAKAAPQAAVYGTEGTLAALGDRVPTGRARCVDPAAGAFAVGDVEVAPFRLSHDAADPVGYAFSCGGRTAAVLTDSGRVTEAEFREIREADLLVLEANHEENILLMGPYPYPLKQRILSDRGHLSNSGCAETLVRVLRERRNPRVPRIALAHISKMNNSPAQAGITVKNRLFEEGLFEGRDYTLTVFQRDRASGLLEI